MKRLKTSWSFSFLLFTVLFCSFHTLYGRGIGNTDLFEFTFITDTHQFGSSVDLRKADINVASFVRYSNEHPNLACAIFGGDFINAYDTHHDEAYHNLEKAAEGFSTLQIPFYTVRGNHDCNGKCRDSHGNLDNSQIITDKEYYDLFSPLSQKSPFYAPLSITADARNPYANYYYRDFWRQKVRLIFLNDYHKDSLEAFGYNGQQMKWLAEHALNFDDKNDPEEWNFLIIGHAFTINHKASPISRLLHAYVKGQDFFDTDQHITYGMRYSQHPRAHMVGLLFGHFHEDAYWGWDGYNMIAVNRGYATGGEVGNEEVCFDHFVLDTRRHTLEERRIGRGLSRLYSYTPAEMLKPGHAFNDVDGMGAFTVGGKGGRILHVTNLNDSGEGSLRAAITQRGSRIVVFDVAGTIELLSPLVVNHDSLTIAGQSSPQKGITLHGNAMIVNASEVIIRYLTLERFRDCDFGHHHLILDHLTLHNPQGTALALHRIREATVQKCRISSESLTKPALLAGGFKVTYLYNLIQHSPRAIKFSDHEGENRWIQLARNIITDWKDHAIYGGRQGGEFTIHGNYLLPSQNTTRQILLDVADDGTGRYFLRNNFIRKDNHITLPADSLIIDRPATTYIPTASDTIYRPFMHPVQIPIPQQPGPTCCTISAFNFTFIFNSINHHQIYKKVLREAGAQYRPVKVCPDSLSGRDVENYLDRITYPERNIVIFFNGNTTSHLDNYSLLRGLYSLTTSDSAFVSLVTPGNFLQSSYATSLSHGTANIDIMKKVQYDAVGLGAHDFDFPFAPTKTLLDALHTPVLSANMRHQMADTLVFAPYTLKQFGHRKVAYVSVTSPIAQVTSDRNLLDEKGTSLYHFDAAHLYSSLQEAVDSARHKGARYVVLLSSLSASDSTSYTTSLLIQKTSGIDAVLECKNNVFNPISASCNKQGKMIPHISINSDFSQIGKLVIDPDGYIYSEILPVNHLKYRDPVTAHTIDSIKTQYVAMADVYVGHSSVALTKPKEFCADDTLSINTGYLLADALTWIADADAAYINTGSIHASLPKGDLKRADIRNITPYENHVVTLTLSGRTIRRFVNAILRTQPQNIWPAFPISNVRITIRNNGKRYYPSEILMFDRSKGAYLPLDDKRDYVIATTDYGVHVLSRSGIIRRSCAYNKLDILYNEALLHYIQEPLGGHIERSTQLSTPRIRLFP